jgi:hypothetical protein
MAEITGGYSPHTHRPLRAYAGLTAVFGSGALAYAGAFRRSRRTLPERVSAGDLALLGATTYKLARIASKDRVTSFARAPFVRYTGEGAPSEVSEEPRGDGLRLAVGELLICPYCMAPWIAAALLGAYLHEPRLTRTVSTLFSAVAVSDFLSQAWTAITERT